jgi:enterochelin esterase family protein
MFSWVGLVMLGYALMGCGPSTVEQTAMIAAPPTCREPGTVQMEEIEDASRGYPYAFNVYLPPCYELETERHYPSLYLLPGQGGSSMAWFTAGVKELADETILSGEMPPFVIIAADNAAAEPMAETIYQDVLPYVESHYRVLADAQYRSVAGGSLGGIRAYRLALNNPGTFASVGIFGSGLIPGEEAQVQSWIDAIPAEQRPRFFFNCGREDPLMLAQAEAMIALLDETAVETTTVFTTGGHNYGYWVSNMTMYWQWVAEDWL